MIESGTTTLLGRIRDGGSQDDRKALVARYWRVIFGYARLHGFNEADAEDFTQDLLMELTRVLPKFDYQKSHGTFRAYLRTITRRRLIDRIRAIRPDLYETFEHEMYTKETEQWWEIEWNRAMLRQCLDEATLAVEPKTFQAFQLLVINEWPPKQVGEFLNLSIESVYQAKVRVAKHTRTVFLRLEQEEDNYD